jgi:hypothetical protein
MDAKDRRIAELEKRVAELEALLKNALEEIVRLKAMIHCPAITKFGDESCTRQRMLLEVQGV